MHVRIVSTGIRHPQHLKALNLFSEGVERSGDRCDFADGLDDSPDVFVLLGSWKDDEQTHSRAKRTVVLSGRPFIVVETPIFGRGAVKRYMADDCFRVGLNGFLNNRGRFVREGFQCDRNRLDMMCERLGVVVRPMRGLNLNAPIVLALQQPGDASLEGRDLSRWLEQCVDALPALRCEKIIRFPQIRGGCDQAALDHAERKGWSFQQGRYDNLQQTLAMAGVTVSYSSGFGVDSLIAGCPAVVESNASFAHDIAGHEVSNLANTRIPSVVERDKWLCRLAYHQWFLDEFESGECWRHLRALMC